MTDTFTRLENLVQDISLEGRLAAPEGQEGFAVVVLKKTRNGSRYHRTLNAGDRLDLSERMIGQYTGLAVDLRAGRCFSIARNFDVFERGRSIYVEAKIRYRVMNVETVAVGHFDPLGELRDKVIATLNRELALHKEATIKPRMIEELIRSVGQVSQTGLMVEDAELINFENDRSVTDIILDEEHWQRAQERQQQEFEASLYQENILADAELERLQKKINAINLTNPNHLMHFDNNIIPKIIGMFSQQNQQLLEMRIGLVMQAVKRYIEEQKEDDGKVDTKKIAQIMTHFLPASTQPNQYLESGIFYEDAPPGRQTATTALDIFEDD